MWVKEDLKIKKNKKNEMGVIVVVLCLVFPVHGCDLGDTNCSFTCPRPTPPPPSFATSPSSSLAKVTGSSADVSFVEHPRLHNIFTPSSEAIYQFGSRPPYPASITLHPLRQSSGGQFECSPAPPCGFLPCFPGAYWQDVGHFHFLPT